MNVADILAGSQEAQMAGGKKKSNEISLTKGEPQRIDRGATDLTDRSGEKKNKGSRWSQGKGVEMHRMEVFSA